MFHQLDATFKTISKLKAMSIFVSRMEAVYRTVSHREVVLMTVSIVNIYFKTESCHRIINFTIVKFLLMVPRVTNSLSVGLTVVLLTLVSIAKMSRISMTLGLLTVFSSIELEWIFKTVWAIAMDMSSLKTVTIISLSTYKVILEHLNEISSVSKAKKATCLMLRHKNNILRNNFYQIYLRLV